MSVDNENKNCCYNNVYFTSGLSKISTLLNCIAIFRTTMKIKMHSNNLMNKLYRETNIDNENKTVFIISLT